MASLVKGLEVRFDFQKMEQEQEALIILANRREMINRLSVDRSRWLDLPIPFTYSVEAEKAEQKFEALRKKTEISERTGAWRVLCSPTRWNFIDWLWSLAEQNPEVGKVTGCSRS